MPETHVPTFCRVCEPSCGLRARVVDGELVGLAPDRDHPVTRGFACNKGLAGVEIHRDPDRLDRPLRRAGPGVFEARSWDESIAEIAGVVGALRDAHGPDAVAFYLGNPLAFNSLAGPSIGAFVQQLGSRRSFSSGTQDCSNKFAAAEAVYGTSTLHPIPDVDHTDHLLVIGSNPRVSHMSFVSMADPLARLREARRRGAVVRHLNPRRVDRADADATVQLRPDTDPYVVAAMLCELERSGRFRDDVLEAHGRHVEGLRNFVRRYPPERVAPVVGIPAERIVALAREFADAPSASVTMSTGANMGRQGSLAYWLVQMLSFVTGNLDRRGGNLYALGFYPATRAGRVSGAPPTVDTPHGRLRRVRGSLPGNLLADMIEERDNPIRALFVVAGNPLLSIGGGERLRRAFEKLELLVCVDLYRNATGELAHHLLPSTDMFERPDLNLCGLGLQHRPFAQVTDAVVPPRGERREEWWIFARLAEAMGMKSMLDHGDDPPIFSRLDHMLARSGLSIEALRGREHPTALLPEPAPGRFYTDWIQTPDGRVDCCPAIFEAARERCEEIFLGLAAEPADQLKLISRRDPDMHNSWYQNVEGMKRRHSLENPLHLSPADAERLGIAAGDRVAVESASGRIEATAAVDDSLRDGVVAMTHGWGNARTPGMRVARAHPGVNANALLPSGPGSYEPESNQAFMTGIPVRVERLA